MELSTLLKRIKETKGVTEEDLAFHLGLRGRSYLSRILASTAPVTETIAAATASLLEMDHATFFLSTMLPPTGLEDINLVMRIAQIRTETIGRVCLRASREIFMPGPQGGLFPGRVAGFGSATGEAGGRVARTYPELRARQAATIRFMAKQGPGSLRALSVTLGLSASLVKYIARQERPLSQKIARRIADRIGIDVDALDFVILPQIPARYMQDVAKTSHLVRLSIRNFFK